MHNAPSISADSVTLSLSSIEQMARQALEMQGHSGIASFVGQACAFLEGVGYPGLKLLREALTDSVTQIDLHRDPLGIDTKNVSCVFLANALAKEVRQNGRIFLRNVRHGLYLLPDSVEAGYGIGCPIDPSFALGGPREKNPYAEKLNVARQSGVAVDSELLQFFQAMNP